MSFFEYFFDSDHKQRDDINQLKRQLQAQPSIPPDHTRLVRKMSERIEELELLNRALLEVLITREIISREELDVVMQQVDLLDGVEDGRLTTEVHEDAPTCGECDRYINPRRKECVYCGAAIEYTRPPKTRKRQVRKVECERCAGVVPQRSTYYTTRGLLCERCFVEVGPG